MSNNILVVFHSNTIKSILKNIKDIDIYNFHIDNSQLIVVYYSYQNHSVSYKIEII
jgi:bisphosphoglycerate-dependent phosphoglycerate mutase